MQIRKNGWIEISKELGIYLDNGDHYYLPDGRPHLKEFYSDAKKSIDKMLEVEDFNDKTCLDLGAGIGWVECYLLNKVKADFIALECNDDAYVGLGRSNKLKEHYKCNYLSVIGDMHNVPIVDNSVDIVFTVDALHHFSDLNKVLSEAYRVLKPGGHFWAVNEPYRPENIADEWEFIKNNTPTENKHGIIERRPMMSEYLESGRDLKLRTMNEVLNFHSPGLILYGEK